MTEQDYFIFIRNEIQNEEIKTTWSLTNSSNWDYCPNPLVEKIIRLAKKKYQFSIKCLENYEELVKVEKDLGKKNYYENLSMRWRGFVKADELNISISELFRLKHKSLDSDLEGGK